MNAPKRKNTETSYDAVADEYVRRIFDELKDKPLDCQLLERFAAQIRGVGLVADIGCGPGHVARYLNERGVHICGLDLSAQMVERAKTLNSGIEFYQKDMNALDVPDGSWAGIVAFYSLIHIPRDQIVETFRELKRVLRPEGILLLSFHIGDEVLHVDEWWSHEVSLDFVLFQSEEMVEYIEAAGLTVDEVFEREPYAPDVEHQSRRCYIFARAKTPLGGSPAG